MDILKTQQGQEESLTTCIHQMLNWSCTMRGLLHGQYEQEEIITATNTYFKFGYTQIGKNVNLPFKLSMNVCKTLKHNANTLKHIQ